MIAIPAAVTITPAHCRRPSRKPKKRSARTARNTSPPDRTACTNRQWRQGERAYMKYPGADRHHPADGEPPGAEEVDRASQRVPHPHGGREDRAAVLEQKGDARRDGAGQGEGESDDHAGGRLLGGSSETRNPASMPSGG
jgi:hypothetical protein